MPKRGKNYNEVSEKVDATTRYALREAIELALSTSYAKFDESVDVALRLGVDPRHSDQMVRGTCVLPHGTGKTAKVVVFAKGEKVKEAEEAGADFVGLEDLVEKIQGGWLDFDKAVATPDCMGGIGRIARILGPRGMMPNAKTGTVTFDVAKAVNELKAGKIDFRVEKAGIVHAPMGKKSFGADKLEENIMAFVETIQKLKPSTSKGTYMKTMGISTTMGKGVKVDPAELKTLGK